MGIAKIVVVDDDRDIRDTLQLILEGKQYEVFTASDKTEGMQTIKEQKPDLAILDVMMSSWQDGFELSRELKGDPELKEMPILMLTGVKEQTGVDFKPSAGDPTWLPVDGFLEKPVRPDILLEEVAKLLPQES
jgi:CheY-like chemotaxis protein